MRGISAVFGVAQTERADAQKIFPASRGDVALSYAINSKSNTLLTLQNVDKMPRISAET